MNGILERVASILERRFLLIAFLPTLIFAVTMALVIIGTGSGTTDTLTTWDSLSVSVQLGVPLAFLAAVWLAAGFVDSQTRNVVRLFEGYLLLRFMPRSAAKAVAWHTQRRTELLPVLAFSPPVGESPSLAASLTAPTLEGTQSYAPEEAYICYSMDQSNVLPTRLGNVLRAAEDYAERVYGADFLHVWPRLASICPERFIRDYEATRAVMEFLLVVSAFCATFSFAGGIATLIQSGPILLFIITVVGGVLVAHLAYRTAIDAAAEYGEQMRSSMDLYRLDLLKQMQFGYPSTVAEESEVWKEFDRALTAGESRSTRYVDPTKPANNSPRQSAWRSSGQKHRA